jgi:NADPH:quinone reductase
MTAHRCLFADGPIEGKTVLVAGGAGAVGHFAIELAKHAGARVITTVSGPQKAQLAAKAGADLVVNYREPDAADQISSFAGPGGVDHVVELALGANLQLDLAVVARPDARIVCYAAEATDPVVPVRACMNANVILRFVLLYGVAREALDRAAADVTAALADGALTELPGIRFPLDQVAAAQDAVEAGAVGKVFVIPG